MNAVFKVFGGLFALVLLTMSNTLLAKEKAYVGSQVCASCHSEQYADWKSSQHHSALQEVNSKTVLGDFNNRSFKYEGVVSRFFKQGEDYLVETDGPDGKLNTYKVRYTIGDYPLQQYLIEYGSGRLQALGIAWDTRPEKDGGQRWFHLYPDQKVDFNSPLHWTNPSMNSNQMCIECHTTDYEKNYDSKTHSFDSQWIESGVGCESCHGPAGQHLEWTKNQDKSIKDKGFPVDLSDQNQWQWLQGQDIAQPVNKGVHQQQIEVCAQCHSRREVITDKPKVDKPLTDNYMPALLRDVLYEVDGQIQDEVFVYGSFKQSKMFEAGVTCSNCHNPHSNKLKAEGNQICASCHNPQKFDSKEHTFHEPNTQGAQCTSCHMPEKTYMVVDPRKDHSFRVPRPDLSIKFGTSNACTQCHNDKTDEWAADAMDDLLGTEWRKRPEFASAFHASRTGQSNAGQLLQEVANSDDFAPIVRATALSEMENHLSQDSLPTIQANLADKDPLVRVAAVTALASAPAQYRARLLAPLLHDSSKAVRLEVIRNLADIPDQQLTPTQKNRRQIGVSEYIAVQKLNNDRAAGRLNLAQFYVKMKLFHQAETEFQQAIKIEPYFSAAYLNLADLYRQIQKPTKERDALEAGLKVEPDSGSINHSMGLHFIRQKKYESALGYLQKASELNPANPRYVYIYGVALHSTGKRQEAINILQEANRRFPENRDILNALMTYQSQ